MKPILVTLIAAFALTLMGCGTGASETDPGAAAGEELTLNVLAAASLQQSFEQIAEEFTAEHPDVSVDFNFAGSSTLVQNLEAGSPADVLATADEASMNAAEKAHLIDADTRRSFAANQLVGIVPADNPAQVSTLEEANAENVNLVICAPQVPCGALSQTLATAAGITLAPVSEEQQVSDVLGKVRSGQADAGLVYETDAALAPNEVDTFDLDGAEEKLNSYPVARTSNSEQPQVAEAFIEFVQSDAGQSVLEAHGFTTVAKQP